MAIHVCVPASSRRWIAVLLLLACLAGPRHALAQTALQPRGPHPYLFFTADEIANLKDRISKEKSAADAWARIQAQADGTAAAPRAGGSAPPTPVETWSLAYRMTGDKKYALKVRDALLRSIARSNWSDAEALLRVPPWHSELGTGSSCFTAAVGFDAVYDALTDDERHKIAAGIVEKGILPTLNDWVLGDQRIHSLDSMGHNWWSACVYMAGIASMSVMNEEPRAASWVRRINEGSVEWFNYSGSELDTKPRTIDPIGALYESANYDNFGMSEYLRFRLAWVNAFTTPPPAMPQLDHAAEYFMHIAYPNSGQLMSLNFGDGSINVNGSRCVELLWQLGQHNPNNLWYLNQTRHSSFGEGLNLSTAMGLLSDPGEAALATAPAAPNLPPSSIFKSMGWATLRSGWGKDSTLLGIKSGFTFNHSHADAGSFILFHHGKYLLINSGNASYNSPEYDAYSRQSFAANTVLINGEAENPEDTYHGSQFPGTVSNLIDDGDLKYVWADATGPTSKNFIRNFRHFLWIGNVILVIDDLKTFQTGQFEWLLHYDGTPQTGNHMIRISQNNASVLVQPLFPEMLPTGLPADNPEAMRLVEKMGFKESTPAPYYALTPPDKSRQTDFITAIILPEGGDEPLPQIERIIGKDMIGARIHQNGTTTEVYLNTLAATIRHRPSDITANGWNTDAYLTAITYADATGGDMTDPDKAIRYFVADGSYLRRDGKLVLDSLSKVFATWRPTDAGVSVTLQGQPIIDARIRAVQKPAQVTLNGTSAPAEFADDHPEMLNLSVRDSQ